jgi:hypothetical protein
MGQSPKAIAEVRTCGTAELKNNRGTEEDKLATDLRG